MKERIKELFKILEETNREIREIQSNCNHPEYFVGMYSWRVGAFNPSRICSICNICISGITQEEEKKCWDDYNRDMQSLIY